MKRAQKLLAVGVCVAFLVGTLPGVQALLLAQETPSRIVRKAKSLLEVKAEALKGQALYSDEKTPVGRATVRIWSAEENKFVYEGTADADGAFTIPALDEGFYYMVIADRVVMEILVSASLRTPQRPLRVIVPRGKPALTPGQLARMLGSGANEAGNPAGGSRGLAFWLLNPWVLAGIIAVAIAVPLAIEDDDDDRKPVSP